MCRRVAHPGGCERWPSTYLHGESQIRALVASIRLALVALSMFAASPAHAAETLESLKGRRAALQQELQQVNTRIAELESSTADKGPKPNGPYYIKEFGIDDVNSAGGVEPYFVFANPNALSPIKYIDLSVVPYNAVGDLISSTIGGKTTAGLRFTGPLSHTDGDKRADWGPIWYNSTANCIKLQSVRVIFVNGKSLSFSGKSLKSALAPGLPNECKLKRN